MIQVLNQIANSLVQATIRYISSPSGKMMLRAGMYYGAKNLSRSVNEWYSNLSEEKRKQVDEIIWWAAKRAISSVLSDAAGEAVQKIAEILGFMDSEIAREITEQVTSKAAELSVDYLKEKSSY